MPQVQTPKPASEAISSAQRAPRAHGAMGAKPPSSFSNGPNLFPLQDTPMVRTAGSVSLSRAASMGRTEAADG